MQIRLLAKDSNYNGILKDANITFEKEEQDYILEKVKKMTLDEAIKHAERKAFELGKCDCASEHIQLAKWLKELKTTKIINIQEHIKFFNRLRAILEICATYEEYDANYIEIHNIDLNADDKSLLDVGYSYTIAEYRDIIPAFEIVPLKYFDMELDEIREDIKRSREEEI